MKQKKISASLKANGQIYLPGSKSITNRVLLMSALSNGETLIQNYLASDDTKQMLNAFKKLNVKYKVIENMLCSTGIMFFCEKNAPGKAAPHRSPDWECT